MIWTLFKRKKANQALVEQQYERLTSAARSAVFYEAMDVPDTVMGRFEMISVHLLLYLRRTNSAGPAANGIAQDIVDAFFEDVDHSIRELGVGDLGVPKRMKKFARMFYGRAQSYGQALDAGDGAALAEALRRNIHPEQTETAPSMRALADWMTRTARELEDIPEDVLAAGRLVFPAAELEMRP
ncbi:MAG: ubiquinol-cytochrome C chaperone family protein [Hoeflea sp.]|uniref:ubiquinol-cytochrome C chaperone family protein n=1 Tax=Hoeflea sp. TaxID=1940281 RepID=UPI002730C353|nr:ubiquinol-cytochrome C chaperone family protein [Hoeflea sp.]MDP2118944.1 ubiquinol-cytochrome C chaperone family protein [Hoeflea sp.]MDP3523240.1 ubiquinol-cytochrome C chaperone family protein [Hoeflea sp.]